MEFNRIKAEEKAEEHERRRRAKRGEGKMPKSGKSVFLIQEIQRKRAEEAKKKMAEKRKEGGGK